MDNLIGKTLDGLYTIQELIGAGGMANVYKAVVSAPGGDGRGRQGAAAGADA